MSWYRTYRSQTIADLDIAPVRQAFSTILRSGEFSHAYLLAGPKGTGKTSAARILAKVLNCEVNRTTIQARLQSKDKRQQKDKNKKSVVSSRSPIVSLSEPCNSCASCVAITTGSSMSVTEMDAASNRGIDDIRELRERIGLSPGDGLICVYIIDEVHMLTTEAFNALLKVLEEPPAHVVFILATTDAQKIPATIVSRATLIQYRKATPEELLERLQKIATAESITISSASLMRIAVTADGSFRDAVKLLEQIATQGTVIDDAIVDATLGSAVSRLCADLLTALLKKETATVVRIFAQISDQGIDGVAFNREVLTLAHSKLVELATANDARLSQLVGLLQAIVVPIEPGISLPWLPFEIACIEYAMQTTANSEQQTGHSKDRHSRGGNDSSLHRETSVKPEDSGSTARVLRPISTASRLPVRQAGRFEDDKEKPVLPVKKEEVQETKISEPTRQLEAEDVSFEKVQAQWPMVLAKTKARSVPLEGLLRAIRLIDVEGSQVKLEAAYQFHKEQIELHRNAVILEAILAEVFGHPLRYSVSLGTGALQVIGSSHLNISGATDNDTLVQAAQDAFL